MLGENHEDLSHAKTRSREAKPSDRSMPAERQQDQQRGLDPAQARRLLDVDPLVERVRAPPVPPESSRDRRNAEADRDVRVRAAEAERGVMPDCAHGRGRRLHERRSSAASGPTADRRSSFDVDRDLPLAVDRAAFSSSAACCIRPGTSVSSFASSAGDSDRMSTSIQVSNGIELTDVPPPTTPTLNVVFGDAGTRDLRELLRSRCPSRTPD